jgi:hypothetical protein
MVRSAWASVLLGLTVAATSPGILAQGQDPGRTGGVELKQNWPNPFNPSTTIPFRLGDGLFTDGHRPVVSLRIYNVLTQLVAIPILQGSGESLDGIRLEWNGTGEYSAYWDGRVLNSDREAASGIYVYQLVVDGRRFMKKMVVAK